jgi:hypothetical protein
MLNPITFTVQTESGPVAVVATGQDYAAYEDAYDKAALPAIAEGRYKTWTYLVWHAMNRQSLTSLTFDEFLASSPDYGVSEKSEDDLPPLESTAPTGE